MKEAVSSTDKIIYPIKFNLIIKLDYTGMLTIFLGDRKLKISPIFEIFKINQNLIASSPLVLNKI